MNLCGLTFVIILSVTTKVIYCIPDCLEPDTRVIGRWKNGNYYKGVVESLTNVMSVLFDNGNRHSYNLHDGYGILEDRIPDEQEIHWGDPVVVHRPHSFAYKPGHIREIVGGRYMVWYNDGSYIYQTKNDIRVFNKSVVCNEPAYLGCYRDQVPRYLTVFIPTRPATVGACVDTCNAQGYSIAALRNSDLCFCGNAYNKGYQTEHKKCDMPCFDNPSEMCGGVGTFSQYWTGIVGDSPVHLPSGLLAHTALHMDPYGFRPSYTTVIRKEIIPRFGKLPWKNIMEANNRAQAPVSLAESSPWRWNALTSSWLRADGKQFRWNKNKLSVYSKVTSRSQTSSPNNRWHWNGKAWIPALRAKIMPAVTTSHRFNNKVHALPVSYHYRTRLGYFKSPSPRVQDLRQYRPRHTQPKPNKTITEYASTQFAQTFTPQLVLQKLAERMSHVKWSQLSNFRNAFKVIPPAPSHFRYVGCFADDYQRDLPYLAPVFPLTTRSCILKCRASRYSVAGIQRSSQCFCGNSYSKYGRVREEQCNMKCIASPRDTCGGVLRNSLYFTGVGSAWPAKPVVTNKPSPIFYGTKIQPPTTYKAMTIKVPGKLASVTYSKVPKPKSKKKLKTSSGSHSALAGKGNSGKVKTKLKKKTKTRNKITSSHAKYEHSDLDDFQVESIKVKLNFSELKKALQTMSPEIVRRVQHDLERINKLEKQKHQNHTKYKVKVKLDKNGGEHAKSNGGKPPTNYRNEMETIRKKINKVAVNRLSDKSMKEYNVKVKLDENGGEHVKSNGGKPPTNYRNEMETIRKKINKVAVNRLSDKSMKEILRIMNVPDSTWKVKSNVIHRKNNLPKYSSTSASSSKDNDEKLAHEEIESYSKISFDFPWKKKSVAKNVHKKGKKNLMIKKLKVATKKLVKPVSKFTKSSKKQIQPEHKTMVKKTTNDKTKIKLVKLKSQTKKFGKTKDLVKPVRKFTKSPKKQIKTDANKDDVVAKTLLNVKVKSVDEDMASQVSNTSNITALVSKSAKMLPKENSTNVELEEQAQIKLKDEKEKSDVFEDALDLPTAPVDTTTSNVTANEELVKKEGNTVDNKVGNSVQHIKDKKQNDQEKASMNGNADAKKEKKERMDAKTVVANASKSKDRKENDDANKEKPTASKNTAKVEGKYKSKPSVKTNDNIEKIDEEAKGTTDTKSDNVTAKQKIKPTNNEQNIVHNDKEKNKPKRIKEQPISSNDTETKREKNETKSHTYNKTDERVNVKTEAPVVHVKEINKVKSEKLSTSNGKETKSEKTKKSSTEDHLAVKPEKTEAVKPDKQEVTPENVSDSDDGVIYLGNNTPDLQQNSEVETTVTQPAQTQGEPASGSGLHRNDLSSEQKLITFQNQPVSTQASKNDKPSTEGDGNSGETITSGMSPVKKNESVAPSLRGNKSENKLTSENKSSLQNHASQISEKLKKTKLHEESSSSFERSTDMPSKTNNNKDDDISQKEQAIRPKSDQNKHATGEDENGDKKPTTQLNKDAVFNGSGAAQVFSGDVGNYVYFGKNKNKEKLPMIRQDDLKRLLEERKLENAMKRSNALNPLNLTGSYRQNISGQVEMDPESSGTIVLNSSDDDAKIYAKSIIPTAPVYKRIRIPKISISKSKAKKTTKSTKYTKTKKSERKTKPSKNDIKYYHNVKGIRVHKNGITFTINKKHKTNYPSVKQPENIKNSHKKVSKNLNDQKTGVHHISERIRKDPKGSTSKDKKRETLESEDSDGDSDNVPKRKFKDEGARNELIWKN